VIMIVGLGNPGRRYRGTRHNAGFEVLDELARRVGVRFRRNLRWPVLVARAVMLGRPVVMVKPQTYMNLSGTAVAPLMRRMGVGREHVVAVVDDVDLPVGRIRVRKRGGAGGHNGLRSLIEEMGGEDFARVRVGIGRPIGDTDLVKYVLGVLPAEERKIFRAAVKRAADAVECLTSEGVDAAMNRFNGSDVEQET